MFAWNYQEDFFAGYDHGKNAGIMSIADHNVVPGKKFWTWGNGPRGLAAEDQLTDSDGPYIELMVGAYSDNQPDYTWLQPYESRTVDAILVSLPRHRRREERQPRRGRQSRSQERQSYGGILFNRGAAFGHGHAQTEGPGFA